MVTKFLDASLLFQLGYGTATKIGCSNFLLHDAWPASPASMAVYEMHSIQCVVAVLPMVVHEIKCHSMRQGWRHRTYSNWDYCVLPSAVSWCPQIQTGREITTPPVCTVARKVLGRPYVPLVTPDLPYCVLPSAVSWCPHFIRHMKCS